MTESKIGLTIGRIHYKTKGIWLFIIPIMITSTCIICIMAPVGLSEMQKNAPNAFHGKYLNYPNLWTMLEIFPVFSLAFVLIAGITTMLYSPHEQQKKPEVEHE